MPEGPEVKIIANQLSSKLVGQQLLSISQIGGRFKSRPETSLKDLASVLPLQIKNINCKGKFLFWELAPDWLLFNTLGMSGKWSTELNKHSAVKVETDQNVVYFEDIRHFGTLKAYHGKVFLDTQLKKLGYDMLSAPPDSPTFAQTLKNCDNKTIVQFLMEQKYICGVGNYIKAEALYRAKISPHQRCADLTTPDIETLRTAIIEVMQESYQMQGATFLTYGNLEGPGKYASFFRVYRRQQDPLGHPVVSEETADKRTTWWVPEIQK